MAQQLTQTMASLETTDGCEDRQQPQIYAKDSLDRFGDDLCALIVSYLSRDDRFRCECVSKQFQRTVFLTVVDITLSDRFMQKLLTNAKTIDTKMLATIAIKFANIQTIDCRGIDFEYEEHIPVVLAIFRDNCLHLREIHCNLWQNSGQTMPTIGPLVTRINVMDNNMDTQSLSHCHRLSHLSVRHLSQVFDTSGQLMAKNLNTFELYFYSNDDYHRLSAFVAHNQSLKCLFVKCCKLFTHDTMTGLSAQLSRLTQLRELTLGCVIMGIHHSLDSWRTIGIHCQQLQRLALDCYKSNLKSLDSLPYYRRLKRLRLRIYADIDEIVLDPLRHCQRLTHLDIFLVPMRAKAVEIVSNNCPQLQYLYIHSLMDAESLSHLSRLPALQMLVIKPNVFTDLSDNDFLDLLSRSPKLKTIKIIQYNSATFYFHNKPFIN
ncbi:unnamed protein product [Medioppia subpectinata]|uniref:F-box domain-containing protein n=1 Tax=Medioppia subpectinata TaxID=1979941 RepID=A0A7R9KH58_9ACAR|nr:unnamed protein product [Medioppia subpectinata]CAG2103467.1 unnamed protein product [Medioppia subpectinata]